MKNKETLEEASEIEYGETKKDLISDLDKIMYKCYMKGSEFGAKWQQEQDKKMYSEEEVLEHLNLLYSMKNSTVDTFTNDDDYITMKWFEQFKKK